MNGFYGDTTMKQRRDALEAEKRLRKEEKIRRKEETPGTTARSGEHERGGSLSRFFGRRKGSIG